VSKRLTGPLVPHHTLVLMGGKWTKVFVDGKGRRWLPSGKVENVPPPWVPKGMVK